MALKLSVIIPVYNTEEFLADAFRSVLSQRLDPDVYEVVVVDDGSTDTSLQIIRAFEPQFRHFKCLSQENGGVSAARNKGMELASGEYLLFLDSDDTYREDALRRVQRIVEAEPAPEIFFFGETYPSTLQKYRPDRFLSDLYFPVYVWKTCIRSDFVRKHRLKFAEGFILEDGVFLLEAILRATQIATFPLSLVHYNDLNKKSLVRDYSDPERNQNMIASFVFVINRYRELIQQAGDQLSPQARNHLTERRESFIFFMFFRMLRYRFSDADIEARLQHVHFHSFTRFPGAHFSKLKYGLLSLLVQHKVPRRWLVSLYRRLK